MFFSDARVAEALPESIQHMTSPDSNRGRNLAVEVAAALARAIPGVGLGVDVLMAAVSTGQRARDEEFFARTAARTTLTEERVQAIAEGREPEFVASAYRIVREAQMTSDSEKLEMLARVLANSGSWSTVPSSDRDELLPIITRLTSTQIAVLAFFDAPREWFDEHMPDAVPNSRHEMLRLAFDAENNPDAWARAHNAAAALKREDLLFIDAVSTDFRDSEHIFRPQTNHVARQILAYINGS